MTGFVVSRCDKQHDGKKILHGGPCRFAIVVADGHYIATNGKRRQRQRWITFTASKDATTVKKAETEAQVKLAETIAAQSSGELVRPTTGTTLIDYLRGWFKSKAGEYRPNSVSAYRLAIEKHISKAPIALMRLSDVKLFDIEQYLKAVKGGPAMKNLHRVVLSKALSEAVRHGVLKTNPATGATLPKRKHDDVAHDAKVNCWSVGEALQFLRTVDAENDPQMAAFCHLGLDAGCRKMEMAALKWSDVDSGRAPSRSSGSWIAPDVNRYSDRRRRAGHA